MCAYPHNGIILFNIVCAGVQTVGGGRGGQRPLRVAIIYLRCMHQRPTLVDVRVEMLAHNERMASFLHIPSYIQLTHHGKF